MVGWVNAWMDGWRQRDIDRYPKLRLQRKAKGMGKGKTPKAKLDGHRRQHNKGRRSPPHQDRSKSDFFSKAQRNCYVPKGPPRSQHQFYLRGGRGRLWRWCHLPFSRRRECTLEPGTLPRGPADQPRAAALLGNGFWEQQLAGCHGFRSPSSHRVVALLTLEEAAFLASPGEKRKSTTGSKRRIARPRGEGRQIPHSAALFVRKRCVLSPPAPTSGVGQESPSLQCRQIQ